MKKRVSFSIEEETNEAITEFADSKYKGNKSMALDLLVADWQYLTARFAALGRRPTEEERAKWDGAGGG